MASKLLPAMMGQAGGPQSSMMGLKQAAAPLPMAPPPAGAAPAAGGIPPNYMGPDQGPFECDNCQFYQDPGQCTKPEVLAEVGDADQDGLADVDPKGCCNLFAKGQ